MQKNKDGSVTLDHEDVDLLALVLQYGLTVADQLGARSGEYDGEDERDVPAENLLLNTIEQLEERGVTIEELNS